MSYPRGSGMCDIWIEAGLPDPDLMQVVGKFGVSNRRATLEAQEKGREAQAEVCRICRIARMAARMEIDRPLEPARKERN